MLTAVAACGGSPEPERPADRAEEKPVEASAPADATPVTSVMPDLTGGNAGRAAEQMNMERELVFEDASGQGRPVDDPADWKICGSRPGPNQQIISYPVVLDVVKTAENCA
ncbi:hypothetical protein SHKM778_34740 [Streptomyces sp. KM77-8]|uniref:PASTA domain-containing protein n=1 Tax=Streptomyces haneummycinicus TaxID=3074435 RepID=A0AAT9HI89_9ACTN